MRKIGITTFVLIAISHFAICQTITTGLGVEDTTYINRYKTKGTIPIITGGNSQTKRLQYSLDNYIPFVLDQGSQNSCTAFAVVEALSIRENYIHKKLRTSTGLSSQVLYSPTYIWVLQNQNKPAIVNCKDEVIAYSDAFSCIFNNQLVDWKTYPYPTDDNTLCHNHCPNEVSKKKIIGRQFSFGDVRVDVEAFKDLLRRGNPICIATNLDLGFYNGYYDKTGMWIKKLESTNEQHAMVVVDFDDDRRLFKVLDSHGIDKGDHGIIWLSYDLVNHDSDKGVVALAYIVSYENVPENGPTSSLIITASNAAYKISGKLKDSTIFGKITDNSGMNLPGVTINAEGTLNATTSDVNGNFALKVPQKANLIASYIGYATQKFKVLNRPQQIYSNNEINTWTKQGYYRIFNGIRFGVVDLDKSDSTVLISIADDITGQLLTNNIQVKVGESAKFTSQGKTFEISLTKIKHAGNILNLANWEAAFISYTLISAHEKLSQYF